MKQKSVLLIGIDAAEVTLVEQLMEQGFLPNLARLRSRGHSLRLNSSAEYLVGSPWPTFYTSQQPIDHGMYHYLIWRPELMSHTRPSPDWLPLMPFWRRLGNDGIRVVALDVPQCYSPRDGDKAVEVCGWATHETLELPASSPPALLQEILSRHGKAPFEDEVMHTLTAAQLLRIRDQCVDTASKVGETGSRLLNENPWDVGIICFSSTHRGGHQLWGGGNLRGDASPAESDQLGQALRDVYQACDTAIGQILRCADDHTDVMVYSLHGMGTNTSRVDLLREMLSRILQDRSSEGTAVHEATLSHRLRNLIPNDIRSRIKGVLPRSLQDRLTLHWRTGDLDWKNTPVFAPFGDGEGYIRINMIGREAQGIVAPGEEFEQWCRKICDGLSSFSDEDTGEPLVKRFSRYADMYPNRQVNGRIPDIIVHWNDSPAARHKSVVSARYGRISWPTPGRHPQGRTGNHRGDGFLLTAGPSFTSNASVPRADIKDIAPTVYAILGQSVPDSFQGRSLLDDRQPT